MRIQFFDPYRVTQLMTTATVTLNPAAGSAARRWLDRDRLANGSEAVLVLATGRTRQSHRLRSDPARVA